MMKVKLKVGNNYPLSYAKRDLVNFGKFVFMESDDEMISIDLEKDDVIMFRHFPYHFINWFGVNPDGVYINSPFKRINIKLIEDKLSISVIIKYSKILKTSLILALILPAMSLVGFLNQSSFDQLKIIFYPFLFILFFNILRMTYYLILLLVNLWGAVHKKKWLCV